jgi:hypothetical protein
LGVFPNGAATELTCRLNEKLWFDADGNPLRSAKHRGKADRKKYRNRAVRSRDVRAESLSELDSRLLQSGIRVLPNLRVVVSWEDHSAVLRFTEDDPNVHLTLAAPASDEKVYWPLRVFQAAEAKVQIRQAARALVGIGFVSTLIFIAVSVLLNNSVYASWDVYAELWRRWYTDSQSGQPPTFPDDTFRTMLSVPLLLAISLISLLGTRRYLKRKVGGRLVLQLPPWRRGFTSPLKALTTASVWSRFPFLAGDRARLAAVLLAIVTVTALLLLAVVGLAGVGVFLAWVAAVIAILAWLVPNRPS